MHAYPVKGIHLFRAVRFPYLLFLFALSLPLLAQPVKAPALDVNGNLPAQPIGPNDLIAVAVYNAPEFTRMVRIGSDGSLRMPMLKKSINAGGLMPADLEGTLADALKSEQLIVDPFVTVTVVEYHSHPISVAGEVKNPLTFQAVGEVSLLDALTRAGGLTQSAGPEILVSKMQKGENGAPATLVQRISVKGLIDQADPELNIKLYGGEEVRVPEVGKVYVLGNVKKPGAFPVRDATDTTVMKTLALAEGLAPFASKVAYVYRPADGGRKNEIPIELQQIIDRKSPDVPLLANDVLYVPDNKRRRTATTALEKTIGFAVATISGVLIYSTIR